MQENRENITEISERIKQVIEYLQLTPSSFASNLGYKRPQSIYDYTAGKVKPGFEFFNLFLQSEYAPVINVSWLISGQGEMLVDNDVSRYLKVNNNLEHPVSNFQAMKLEDLIREKGKLEAEIAKWSGMNAEQVGEQLDTIKQNADEYVTESKNSGLYLEKIKTSESTVFQHLGDERYLIIMPLINRYNHENYHGFWINASVLDSFPKHAIAIDTIHFGIYRSFEVPDQTMEDETRDSLVMGDIVIARRIERKFQEMWHFPLGHIYVIHFVNGICIRRIESIDHDNQSIRCKALNPAENNVPAEIQLSTVREIFKVEYVTQKR
ncbi:hypothetical protein MUK70_12900 [Dyadobacter chenwenxiniae]|uniref:Peptidase S24/S26A/S26B/S26C domain-containing protein n=1 Tax=Dyadobacter chenwenxiniae TaxID=2906456 RepID=A0A9X1PG79_9BACT|nr:hypothetical protein [Dyadobacter chenwenxiniae]MCF0060143.1 hypothetical protein [Dyadobacter chenwenxiniae]UON85880.1 hypothetical protein MUK70_12900 [Dyadobacter chenwenxiniae]